jgi:hypothetical protein
MVKILNMVEITSKRQQNNILQIREFLWNWIDVKEGDEVTIKDNEGKKGRFISFWKTREDI